MSEEKQASTKAFISGLTDAGQHTVTGSIWVQGIVTKTKLLDNGLSSVVLDDSTGVIACVPSSPPTSLLDDMRRNDLKGKYVEIIGRIERNCDEGDAMIYSRIVITKCWILDDPNLESLWITEVLRSCTHK